MSAYRVRTLQSEDFDALMRLEEEIFAADDEAVLGPYYVRLCCDFFADTCFVVTHDDAPVGYVLCFVRGTEAYCTTLAIVPEHQGTRAAALLLRGLVAAIIGRCDRCWFTVKTDNAAARSLHAALGAKEVGIRRGFYGPGDERLVSCIDTEAVARLRRRYERLGLLPASARTEPAPSGPSMEAIQ